jgi:hypothetical protein
MRRRTREAFGYLAEHLVLVLGGVGQQLEGGLLVGLFPSHDDPLGPA